MEPIEVTAHFSEEGVITPLHFTWKGGVYRVESTGRRWVDELGQHMLSMVSNGQIYELIFTPAEARWYIAQIRPDRMVI